jgi:DNA invertase Pin-like site-specific DNA recombinase
MTKYGVSGVASKKFGYARVSMDNQDLALQLDALTSSGVCEDDIFIEKISGKLSKADRPQLDACMKTLREGNMLVVWKLDRLGRSLKDLINIIQELEERKIQFSSLTETINTSSPIGRLIFHIIGAFGEFERNLIKERSAAGLAAAKKRGIIGGRKRKLSKNQQTKLVLLYKTGTPVKSLLQTFRISRTCLYDYLHFNGIILRNVSE